MILVFLVLALSVCRVRAEDGRPDGDRFADEPVRPKADSPCRFLESYDEARAEAGRSGRRILVYFTGRSCGWCRVMEKRTLTDAEVVRRSREYVCVKLDLVSEPRRADELQVDAIPRSFILTSEGTRVDMVPGYRPATEFADWLREGLTKPPAKVVDAGHRAPPSAGAGEHDADLLIWFVDGKRTIERWADPGAFAHPQLFQILRDSGLTAHVEHFAYSEFPSRWDKAGEGRLPDLIAMEHAPALARSLEQQGRLINVLSERLGWAPGQASCPDFAHRLLQVVRERSARTPVQHAVRAILSPGPETDLPGPHLSDAAAPAEAQEVARSAARAYVAGDAPALAKVASADSPQLTRCTKAQNWQLGLKAEAGPAQVRGGSELAFARVEMTYQGEAVIGTDPYLVVLRREGARWKALTITNDIKSLEALPELCLRLKPRDGAADPATPRLVWPENDAVLPDPKGTLRWNVADGGDAIVAQPCELISDHRGGDQRGESWPGAILRFLLGGPGEGGSVSVQELATGMPVTWRVWTIGVGGKVAISNIRQYDFADYKSLRSTH